MTPRLLIVTLLLLASAGYVARASHAERVPPRAPLSTIPTRIGAWQGEEGTPFEARILEVLGVDEYVNRFYTSPAGWVSLYVGFYASQRQGSTIHSPLNCLPGAGWLPVSQERATIQVTDSLGAPQAITVNQFIIQKGLDRQVALYWYQSHGRVVASEYASKAFMVYDAMRTSRTDAAMIRVITPIVGAGAEADGQAVQRSHEFVQQIFPSLGHVLPS